MTDILSSPFITRKVEIKSLFLSLLGQSINFSPGSSSPLNMTNSLRKDDSNKMSEKGQQVRVMQPVGDRVIVEKV